MYMAAKFNKNRKTMKEKQHKKKNENVTQKNFLLSCYFLIYLPFLWNNIKREEKKNFKNNIT